MIASGPWPGDNSPIESHSDQPISRSLESLILGGDFSGGIVPPKLLGMRDQSTDSRSATGELRKHHYLIANSLKFSQPDSTDNNESMLSCRKV
jgi:hypothetical protein